MILGLTIIRLALLLAICEHWVTGPDGKPVQELPGWLRIGIYLPECIIFSLAVGVNSHLIVLNQPLVWHEA